MANPALQTTRAIQDATLQVTTTLGDNASTNRGNALDLGSITPFPVTERLTVQISTTAATGANNKNVNIRLQHANANANANFVNIPTLAIVTIPELNAAYAATTVNFALPPDTRQYIRVIAVTESSGGNASDGSVTLKVLF
jgi:hypothetical protein